MKELFTPSKFVRQAEAGECGLACLAMVARHYGDQNGLAPWRRRFPLSSRGSNLKTLMTIADLMGFNARAVKVEIDSLAQLQLPAVLHWNMNHYVVLNRIKERLGGRRYLILDPATGPREMDAAAISGCFTGVALELAPRAAFQPARRASRLHLSQLWTRIRGLKPALARILVLSAILQIVVLATPFYTQLAVDTVLPGSDVDLLNIIALGFTAILVLNALVTWLRSRLVLTLSSSLSLQTAANLFRHTIYLPIAWFEKRHLGDITSRFASLQPISDLLSRGLVSAMVDGALAATTLVLMIIYSGPLAALTCGMIGLYAALKALSYKSMRFANANLLAAQAGETSAFIENVRGVSAIKAFCQEANRQRIWQNKKAEVVNGGLRLGRLTSGFDAANALMVGVENLAFIYVAMKMIIAGKLTLGMAFAFQAYKQSFVGAFTRLVDQTANYRMLDVHLDRISDLALEPCEPDDRAEGVTPFRTLELENVSFSYGSGLPLVLKNVSMRMEAGKTTVIVGSSGSGKTTAFKILCGLLQPTSGRVLVDGLPIQEIGLRRYRDHLGVVSQEDVLFAGSIAENIAFFDPDYDLAKVQRCCAMAGVDQDIIRMPMKYDTTVGDMGSSLSGGQRQRVLLARALYKEPSFLMLDEGTAHLDVSTEARIVHTMKQQAGGRLLVAHRPETIRAADVIYEVRNGAVQPIAPLTEPTSPPRPVAIPLTRGPASPA